MGTDTLQVHWFSSTLQQLGDPLVSLGGIVNGIALVHQMVNGV